MEGSTEDSEVQQPEGPGFMALTDGCPLGPAPGSSGIGLGPLCVLGPQGTRTVPIRRAWASAHRRHPRPPHLYLQQPLHFASAVACGPGTHFSGELGQCVPCMPGTYQDTEGQLSCTPCPSSDGLGLAGARNVSECGGKCGPTLEGEVG